MGKVKKKKTVILIVVHYRQNPLEFDPLKVYENMAILTKGGAETNY
jgi:hypothetical protein